MRSRSTILVLTGSIAPKAGRNTIDDPKFRSAEYARSIRHYLEKTDLPILFAENSEHPFEEEPEWKELLNAPRVRLHRDPEPGRPERGKGYEEFRMLDRLVEKLSEEGYERMLKVTGRYIVRNIQELIPEREDRAHFDLHPRIKTGIAISSVFVTPLYHYRRHIKGLYASVNEGERITIEKLLFQRLMGLKGKEATRLLPREPDLEGYSGTWGTPIGRNPYRLLARNIFRRLLIAGGWRRIPFEL